MILTELQEQLFDFVKLKHGSQVRKYTGEPYYNHLLNVAKIVSEYEQDCVEIALCHDLFEDTTCTFDELHRKMVDMGFERRFTYDVCTKVQELTDKFTKEDYPYLNRIKRKESECKRLSEISYKAQTVKYADLIDNTGSIVGHDENFAHVYLKEKQNILNVMTNGNTVLLGVCRSVLTNANELLKTKNK